VNSFAIPWFAARSPVGLVILPSVRREPEHPLAQKGVAGDFARALVLVFLLFVPLPNRARPQVATVPFRTAQTFILVQAKVNGNPATLLLDTGANRTTPQAQLLLQSSA
jgi:hypothetical protein